MFCYACISHAQNNSPSCPSCQSEEYELHYSKNVEQSLKELHVQCENHDAGCKWTGELGQYDSHLNLNSQLEERMSGCQYAKIQCHKGCGKAISRHDILVHEMEKCSQKSDGHTELEKLLHIYIQKLLHELSQKDEQIADLKSELLKLKKEVQCITTDREESAVQKLMHEVTQEENQIAELEREVMASNKELLPIISDPDESAIVVPIQRAIAKFTEMQKLDRDYVSAPFYTHPGGYKMCLWVFPNGYGDAENTHLSVFTCFMQGENDEKLKWPFCGNITVQLIDQVQNRDHRERVISYDEDNSSYAQRLRIGYKSKGWGQPKMILLKSLREETCPYLKDDCLKIRITKVELDFS